MTDKQHDPFVIREQGALPGFSFRQHEGEDVPTDHEEVSIYAPLHAMYTKALLVFFVLIGVVISVRVVQLQLFNREEYALLAQGNRIKIERTVAPRGRIYDRALSPLVANIPQFDLKVLPINLPEEQSERERIADVVGAMISEDEELWREQVMRTIIERDLTQPVVTVIEDLPHEDMLSIKLNPDLPGIVLEQGVVRTYTGHESLSHVLGYLGELSYDEWKEREQQGYYFGDVVGRSGLEQWYETTLRGQDEQTYIEIDVRGNESRVVSQEVLTPGNNIVLSIDAKLQEKLAESLTRHAQYTSGRGAAVAVNPTNGEILALVSVPTYDNNIFIQQDNAALADVFSDEQQPLFNRAISGTYPPGSTFKPVVAAGALSEGIITPSSQFLSTGGLALAEWYFPDWQAGGHGWTNLAKSIAESVNTYYYYIGGGFEEFQGLGVSRIDRYARQFGFDDRVGIDLPGEQEGFLPTKQWKREAKGEPWYIGDTYHLSIGQGDVLVTPLQLAMMMSVFANGGTLYQPQIVKSVTDTSGAVVEEHMPQIATQQVMDAGHIRAVRRGLRETVLTGSARSLGVLPVSSAGKTGTAQVGGNQEPHGWFAGFAPYENSEIVLIVLVENGIGGSTSATPVFREVIEWYFTQQPQGVSYKR